MTLFGRRRPNVKALARSGDTACLCEAAGYVDLMPQGDGSVADLGAPVREEAVRALGELGGDYADSVVVRALRDRSDRVRAAAVEVLRGHGRMAPLAEALGWLPEGSGRARELAIEALFEFRPEGCARQLTEALLRRPGNRPLSPGDGRLVCALLQAEAREEATIEVIAVLLAALRDPREVVSERAAALLMRLGPASVEPLIDELATGAARDRAAAVLGAIKDVRALEALRAGLDQSDASVRAESCFALGELRDPAAVEALLHATRDPEYVVRARAGSALDRIGMVGVVVGVSTLLRPLLPAARSARGLHYGLPSAQRLLPASTQPAVEAERSSLVRRLARFIERVGDARVNAAESEARPPETTVRG
jgi:HEAT repeat protein